MKRGVAQLFLILLVFVIPLVAAMFVYFSQGDRDDKEVKAVDAPGVLIKPGDNIQTIVNSNPTGTIFNLTPGTYMNQKIAPKDGQSFIGQTGAILDGGHSTDYVFHGTARDVTIKGLIIQDYAPAIQQGAIQVGGSNWTIENNEIRRNKSGAIFGADRSRILNNKIHHNGQIGIKVVGGSDALVEGNEIAHNNCAWPSNATSTECPWPGSDPYWEAGGTKFVKTTGLVIRGNYAHDNVGPGLWTDIDNRNTLFENNRAINNSQHGIFHEISFDAIIKNNEIRCNGWERAPAAGWGWGGNILISTSQGTVPNGIEIYGNTVEACSSRESGITLIQQGRGSSSGGLGTYRTRNVYVHHNNIGQKNTNGLNGGFSDSFDKSGFLSGNNRFDYNKYYFTSADCSCFEWASGIIKWSGFKAAGHEANGTIVSGTLPPITVPTPTPISTPPPTSTPQPIVGQFKGEFFNNRDLSGSPVATINTTKIDYDWGTGSPLAGVSVDNFSARFTGQINFDGSSYRFNATGDDGIRIKVDGVTVVDGWKNQAATSYNALKSYSGVHTVVVEYYDNLVHATARANWVKASTCFDMTGDGKVTSADLTVIANHYGTLGVTPWDVTGDQRVNAADQGRVSSKNGTTCS